ncbi:HemK/PrmC family methyltransferase [Hankyongella ginsenosidimutans]|uniref:N5-glutamine methyltransferase family protein n=1 Tax=Hankyongella ginsenosidimutans TaxID=1763828 RepID=UPI00319E132C
MTGIRETLRQARVGLEAVGIETARLDAELLLAEAMGMSRNILLLGQDRLAVDGPSEKRFTALLARRLRREPVAHILGLREFWSLDFKVSPATLIPRPDSETLVEAGLQALAPVERPRILDLGVGSGCLLIALLHERRDAQGSASTPARRRWRSRAPTAGIWASRAASIGGRATGSRPSTPMSAFI